MTRIQRADERYPGGDPAVGIETRHALSFGPHYDPDNLRFGALLACNEERLAPGAGFDEHPHSHTEIVTWVVEGELTHHDSAGHTTVVRPGDLQRLSSAGGVRHVERNDGDVPLVFVQMWLAPLAPGGEPSYEVVRGVGDAYGLPAADAVLHVRRLGAGERTGVPAADFAYVHVVRGTVRIEAPDPTPATNVTSAPGSTPATDATPATGSTSAPGSTPATDATPAGSPDLAPGDAVRLIDATGRTLVATADAEVLVWEMRDWRKASA
ncbi:MULTISPECIES: pirin family protein [unclassified Streptomyces]|uniref:pirin family protein n=1 Tax=unclassified Streptomyces TaxID=2593676 RepID=UPI0016601953|nr:pirin family protein [Streptomyces sp. CBMA291]MBD0715897.1 pirin family protein [Streptomyces sp. CBMA370]